MGVKTQVRDPLVRMINGGVLAGLVGCGGFILLAVVDRVAHRQDLWTALQRPALPLLGMTSAGAGISRLALAVSLGCQLCLSLSWGVLFGRIFYGLSARATVVAGMFWGVAGWLMLACVVLPLCGAPSMLHSEEWVKSLSHHLLFGAFVAVGFLPFQRPAPAMSPST